MASHNGCHKGRHSSRRATGGASGKTARTSSRERRKAPYTPLLFGNGHSAPNPAQFGARQDAHRPTSTPFVGLPRPLFLSMFPLIRSTAEREAMAISPLPKAHSPGMTQHTPPFPASGAKPAASIADPPSLMAKSAMAPAAGEAQEAPVIVSSSVAMLDPVWPAAPSRDNKGATVRPHGPDLRLPLIPQRTPARPLNPSPAGLRDLPRPAFPPPQLPRIGPDSQGHAKPPLPTPPPTMPMPLPRPLSTPSGRLPPVVPPASQANPPHLAATSPRESEPCALPLPRNDEPLTHNGHSRSAIRPLPQGTPLPRSRSLTKPGTGLLGALNTWLRKTGQMLAASFMVKKKRSGQPSPATLRERTELTQLRAENRRLRHQLEGMTTARGHPPQDHTPQGHTPQGKDAKARNEMSD